jgi:uncharacterized protein
MQSSLSSTLGIEVDAETYRVVKQYAAAWLANDLRAIIDCYHDDVVFHYFGRNPLAGTHAGKAACLNILKQVREKTNRKLIEIRDVLVGKEFGLIIAVESFQHDGATVEIERMLRYSVRDGKLAECWIYDEDQRLVDNHFA